MSKIKINHKQIKILNIIIIFALAIIITYFLCDKIDNVIDKTFTLSTMLAFVGIGLSMFVFLNGYVQNLRKTIIQLDIEYNKINFFLEGLNRYFKEIKEDLYIIYIGMISLFILAIIKEMPIIAKLNLNIWFFVITKNTLIFFLKTSSILFALRALCDIFSSIMGINKFGDLISKEEFEISKKKSDK